MHYYRIQSTAFPFGARLSVERYISLGLPSLHQLCTSSGKARFPRRSLTALATMAAQEPEIASHCQRAWEMFRSWGSPKYYVAPMVDQVCRREWHTLLYSTALSHKDVSHGIEDLIPLSTWMFSRSWRSACSVEGTVQPQPTPQCYTAAYS